MSNPWTRPPFWAKGHSPAELQRRAFLELAQCKEDLHTVAFDTPAWHAVYRRVQELEAELNLTPTDRGVGMPGGVRYEY